MASRAEQKAKAKAERIAYERQLAEAARRKQRLARLAGVVIAAAVLIVAAIVISSSHSAKVPQTFGPGATASQTRVNTLLAGIPESGNTLGKPSAPITVTEYGDLECSACDAFALASTVNTSAGVAGSGVEDQLIENYVSKGQAQLIYRSLDTVSPSSTFPTQQAAAEAAGLQQKAWYYIELFYNEQGQEDSGYVTQAYLDRIAKQVPGLNYSKWLTDLNDPSLTTQVSADEAAAAAAGYKSTPTIVVKGPKGTAAAIQGVPTWSGLQQVLKEVT